MRSLAKPALTATLVAALTGALWLLWPASLGGRTSYVITHGNSMEPSFHTGDLAILHRTASYRVGDVAAYHSRTLHLVVMHRIHTLDAAGGYVFKGDNNAWLDPDHPAKAMLLGRLWLHVPEGGYFLDKAHSPWVLGLLAAMIVGLGSAKVRRRRSRRVFRARTRVVRARAHPIGAVGGESPLRGAAISALAVAVLATLAAGFLWSMATTRAVSRTITVTHAPTLAYAGEAHRGVTYPDGRVHTGQTAYLRLVHRITFQVSDDLRSTAGITASKTAVILTVTLSTPAGWSTTLASGPAAELAAGPVTATVDLDAAEKKLREVSLETGVSLPGAAVVVTAQLASQVTAGQRSVDAAADATWGFTLDPTGLRPTATPTTAASVAPASPGHLSTSVQLAAVAPATLTLWGSRAAVTTVRLWLTLAAVLGWLVAGLLMPYLLSDRGDAVDAAIRTFGGRLVEVSTLAEHERVAHVGTAGALLRIADRYDRLVMYLPGDHGGVFAVVDDGISYRLTVGETAFAGRDVWVPA